ncbi:MAG: hypothetical protein Q4P28_06410 [Tissierellia bacterium]|nr:hypothetical protein [Tissierellia bacterium]
MGKIFFHWKEQHIKETNIYYKILVHSILIFLIYVMYHLALEFHISKALVLYGFVGLYSLLPVIFYMEEDNRILAMAFALLFYLSIFIAPILLIYYSYRRELKK